MDKLNLKVQEVRTQYSIKNLLGRKYSIMSTIYVDFGVRPHEHFIMAVTLIMLHRGNYYKVLQFYLTTIQFPLMIIAR